LDRRLTRRLLPCSDFGGNDLNGTIPTAFASMPSLQSLYVHVFLCRGDAHLNPAHQLCLWRHRNLGHNSLSGTVPAELSALQDLSSLCVASKVIITGCGFTHSLSGMLGLSATTD
jgi:hypothetical protein